MPVSRVTIWAQAQKRDPGSNPPLPNLIRRQIGTVGSFLADAMDPSVQELAAFASLNDVQVWTATGGDLGAAFLLALGGPTLIREVVLIAKAAYTDTMNNLQIDDGTGATPPVLRGLTPVEIARLTSLRRACRMRVAAPPDEEAIVTQAPL